MSRAWDDAVGGFLSHASAERGLAANSLEAYARDLHSWGAWAEKAGRHDPAHAAAADLRAFLIARSDELGPRSRARLVSTLRSFHRFLVAEGLATRDPTLLILAPQGRPQLPSVLTLAQIERLLAAAAGRHAGRPARPRDPRGALRLRPAASASCAGWT